MKIPSDFDVPPAFGPRLDRRDWSCRPKKKRKTSLVRQKRPRNQEDGVNGQSAPTTSLRLLYAALAVETANAVQLKARNRIPANACTIPPMPFIEIVPRSCATAVIAKEIRRHVLPDH